VIFVAICLLAAMAGLALHVIHAQASHVSDDVVHPPSTSPAGTPLDASAFATGACMAYPPSDGDSHRTIFLDAGHGGVDPGGVGVTESGQTISESDVDLNIELDVMTVLRARGFRVVVSRTSDTTVVRLRSDDTSNGVLTLQGSHDDVAARDVCANLAKANALVGIYMDAGGSALDAGSVSLYDTDRPFSQENLQLAELLQGDVLSAMNAQGWQIPDDGFLPDTGFGSTVGDPTAGGLPAEAAAYDHLLLIGPAMTGFFSTPSQMPGAVIEPLYLTDPFEGSIAASSSDQEVIAQGIATAIENYFDPTSGST
jgi:N-acetylmuramoyl-L-alanine amidase